MKTNSSLIIKSFPWLLVLLLVGFGVYSRGLGIQYYGDDFQFVFDLSPPTNLFSLFFRVNPFNIFTFRPLQAVFLALIQRYFGLNTLPVHVSQILIHIFLCWLIYIFMLKVSLSPLQAFMGSLFMAVSQANGHAVLSNDTLSQVCGTFFSCLSLWLIWQSFLKKEGRKNDLPYEEISSKSLFFLSVAMFFLALLSKETSVSFFPLIVVIILLAKIRARNSRSKLSLTINALIEICPYLIALVGYLVLRSGAVADPSLFHSAGYGLHIGFNIVRNMIMLLSAALLPVSTVTTFSALQQGEYVTLAAIMVLSLIFILFVAFGVWRSHRPALVFFLGISTLIGSFPTVMLSHVSELYVYNFMPFASALIGMGVGKNLELGKRYRWRKLGLLLAIAFLLASHIGAIQSKALLMLENGKRANILLSSIEPYLSQIPRGGKLLLVNPPANPRQGEYSVFLLRGFNVLKWGTHRIKQLSGREDFEVSIIEPAELKSIASLDQTLILSLCGEKGEVCQFYP
ncbi:MAG: hypothetical protein K6U11_01590 [bacterium]|nr:hypothetical protein [bacterium]